MELGYVVNYDLQLNKKMSSQKHVMQFRLVGMKNGENKVLVCGSGTLGGYS